MEKRIFTQIVLMVAVLAITAVCEEKPLSLSGTKWKLAGFVDVSTNTLEEPDYSVYGACGTCPRPTADFPNLRTENWFTLEFDSNGEYYSGYLTSGFFNGCSPDFNVDYTYSTITFGDPAMTDGPNTPTDRRCYWALRGSQKFELTDTLLKIYYLPRDSDRMEYLLFKPWEEPDTSTPSKVQDTERIISQAKFDTAVAVIVPSIVLVAGDFAAGPNPVAKSAGLVNFYRVGKRVKSASLKIYNVSGKIVGRLNIDDGDKIGDGQSQSKRHVGSWDLKDAKGCSVSEGTYLVKGTIKTVDRKSEKIALLIGVR